MGCDTGRDEEKPVHRVYIDAFEMAVCQVRNRDFAFFLDATGHPAPPNWNAPDFNHRDSPVVAVSWFEAMKYCDWLTQMTGRSYRLPTEAEWERAGRSRRRSLSVGERSAAGPAGVFAALGRGSARTTSGGPGRAKCFRDLRSLRERPRVVRRLVPAGLLCGFTPVQSAGPASGRAPSLARWLAAPPCQGEPLRGAFQHSAAFSVR